MPHPDLLALACPCWPQAWAQRFAQLPDQLQEAVLGAAGATCKGDDDRPARCSHLRLVCQQWRERVDAVTPHLDLRDQWLHDPPATATTLRHLLSRMPSLTSLSLWQLQEMGDLALGWVRGAVRGLAAEEGRRLHPFPFIPPRTMTQLQNLTLGLSFFNKTQIRALGLPGLSQLRNLTHLSLVQVEVEPGAVGGSNAQPQPVRYGRGAGLGTCV